jgi:hypothetical protein
VPALPQQLQGGLGPCQAAGGLRQQGGGGGIQGGQLQPLWDVRCYEVVEAGVQVIQVRLVCLKQRKTVKATRAQI